MFDSDQSKIWPLLAMFGIVSIFIGSIVIFFISFLVNELINETDTLNASTQIIAIVVNGLLSLGLILIYSNISESESEQERWMQEQTEILDKQQDLMAAQFKPILSISLPDNPSNEDEFNINCTNDGTGIARDIELELDLFISDSAIHGPLSSFEGHSFDKLSDTQESSEVEIHGSEGRSWTEEGVEGFWGHAGSLAYSDLDGNEERRSEPVVKPDEEELLQSDFRVMHYRGIAIDPNQANPLSFERGTEKLADKGYTIIGYRISCSYDNILNDTQKTELLASGYTELEPGMDFEDIYENSVGMIAESNYRRRLGGQRYVAMTAR